MSVCKICLCIDPTHDLTQISTENVDHSGEYILLFCLGIQVIPGSENTTKLCEKCFTKLVEFHEFKSLALRNEASLSSLGLQKFLENSIKHETNSDDDDYDDPLVYNSEINDIQEENACVPEIEQEVSKDTVYVEISKKIPETNLKQEQSKDEHLTKKKEPIKRTKRKRKSGKKQSPQTCEKCGKKCATEAFLAKHLRSHIPKKLKQTFHCDYCMSMFMSKSNIKMHILKFHSNSSSAHHGYKTVCDYCTESFSTHRDLREHLNVAHAGLKPVCPICNECITEVYLRTHMIAKHRPPSYQCETCGKKFLDRRNLETHRSVHTGLKPYSCDMCDAKFRLKYSVKLHKAQVHEKLKNHICHICSKRYFTSSLLQRHIRRIHPDTVKAGVRKLPDKFKEVIVSGTTGALQVLGGKDVPKDSKEKPSCPDCGKVVSSRKTLKRHQDALHSDLKHICKICHQTYSTRYYLVRHMKIHTQERNFRCKFCSSTFNTCSGRRRHELNVHINAGVKRPTPTVKRRSKRNRKKKNEQVKTPVAPIVTVTVPQIDSLPENSRIVSLFSEPVKLEHVLDV